MFREGTKPKKKEKINALISDGGMGDIICALPALNYILKEVTWVDPIIWVPDYLLEFAKNVLPKKANVQNYSNGSKNYDEKLTGISTRWNTQHTPMRTHPIDYSFRMLTDGDAPSPEYRNYLKFNADGYYVKEKYNLPEKYIAISVGATTKPKELSSDTLNQIVDYVLTKGYTPVFLGKSESRSGYKDIGIVAKLADVDYTKGIDLTNKTSLCETAAIIAKANAFIGMEGGLTHLAGFTDTPIIAGYSFVDPKIMQPIRNNELGSNCYPVVPDESLECRFCQSRIALLYGHDFRECYYGPEDYTCLKQLTFDKWKIQIDKVLL